MRRLAHVSLGASPVLFLMIAGCAQGGFTDAGGRPSLGDAGPRRDAGEPIDAGARDAGPTVQIDASALDAAIGIDATVGLDAGPRCTGPAECDDGSACTTDTCELGECVHTPGPMTPGGSCASPIDISAGGTFTGDSSCAAADFTGACAAGDAPDVHFTFTVPSTASVTLDSLGTSFDAVLALGTSCLGGELGCDDETAGGGQARLTRAGLTPGTYHVVLDGKAGAAGGPWILNVAITTGPTMETVSFPSSGDPASRADGLFWHAGDYVQGTRATSMPNATGASIVVVIGENYLGCGDTQDMRMLLNGIEVGRFSITSGVSSVTQTFSFTSVTGPTYQLRYETVRTVMSGCGSAQVLPGGSVTLTR